MHREPPQWEDLNGDTGQTQNLTFEALKGSPHAGIPLEQLSAAKQPSLLLDLQFGFSVDCTHGNGGAPRSRPPGTGTKLPTPDGGAPCARTLGSGEMMLPLREISSTRDIKGDGTSGAHTPITEADLHFGFSVDCAHGKRSP